MKRLLNLALCIALSVGMLGCGSGSSDGGDPVVGDPVAEPASVTGQFVDSFVVGLGYECSSGKSGTTNANGEFTCLEGDSVDFYLGEYFLGSSDVKEKITPVDLYPDNEVAALNVAQLLQTIDENNDPSDGIVIPENFTALDNVATTPEAETFETDVEVNLGKALVEEIDAKAHLDIELTGKAPFAYAYVQWRTYEDPARDGIRVWVTLPEGMMSEDVSDLTLEDADGIVIADFESFTGSADNYLIYDCRVGECTSKIKNEFGYFRSNLPVDTPEGTYTYTLTTISGEMYEKSVVYQGQIELPALARDTIVPQWNADGSLTVKWDDPSWINAQPKDQVRVNVQPATFTEETIIVKLNPTQPSEITIPSSVVDSVFDEIDRSWFNVYIQARAYDSSGHNYARGLSDSVELRPEILPVKFRPINEVGTGETGRREPDAYAAIDFLTIDADVTTDLSAVTFTYETRADFQNATTDMPNENFGLGMWFDRNGNDEFDMEIIDGYMVDAMLFINQDLSSGLVGCSSSPTFTAKQEGNFVSVTVPWLDLSSCVIYEDTPVRFWGHYSDDTTGVSQRFPNVW